MKRKTESPHKLMTKIILSALFILSFHFSALSQKVEAVAFSKEQISESLNEMISDLEQNYIYLKDKNIDLNCIRTNYKSKIENIKTDENLVLFFEYLLGEFYDSHLILNTNRKSSFRLFGPIHTKTQNNRTIITSVWQTQISNLDKNIIGAEVITFNGKTLNELIDQFPTSCTDKKEVVVRTWIANKILAGRYNEPRKLELKLQNGKRFQLDLDNLQIKKNNSLLSSYQKDNIGIIRINNSLGNNELIATFDQAIDSMMNTKGLIIDLRNTVDGGNSYVGRAIMGRFIREEKPYQKHWTLEEYISNTPVVRSWEEYVSPRGIQYTKPVVVLVDRWTGSMGEGMAIGFEGMKRAEIVGTEMEQLAGAMNGFGFKNLPFGYRISTEKLFHINGTPREKYIPTHLVIPKNVIRDEILEKGIEIINKQQ